MNGRTFFPILASEKKAATTTTLLISGTPNVAMQNSFFCTYVHALPVNHAPAAKTPRHFKKIT